MAVELAGKYEVDAWQGHEPLHLSAFGLRISVIQGAKSALESFLKQIASIMI